MPAYAEYIKLSGEGFCHVLDITEEVSAIVHRSGIAHGTSTVFCPGSTGSIATLEFEDGAVADLKRALDMVAPTDATYEHNKRWGDGNGFSHVRAALMKPSITVPIIDGKLTLGTWQQIVFIDFDNRPRERSIVVQITGDSA